MFPALLCLAHAIGSATPQAFGTALPPPRPTILQQSPHYTDAQLLDEVEHRAFRFFWEEADTNTGLVKDRAGNHASDAYTVASIASTGYALAALPVGVERGWVTREEARARAERTLRFILEKMPANHGWYYHFVDMRTGERVWKCEVSTIDTCLLVAGALVCGQYLHGEVEQLANRLYDGLGWTWARTNGGAQPDKLVVTMGWKPEEGFLKSDWSSYCELPVIYLLGLGAQRDPLPPASWTAWKRPVYAYAGMETLAGGPIFFHEMAFGYYDLRNRRDGLGWDYAVAAANGVRINRRFCMDHAAEHKTYGPNVWGLNASDGPNGYNAYGVPRPEDGTVSPTGALAAILFIPREATAAGHAMYAKYGDRLWGRYGFGNAFNVDADWYDPDVIGIDLGMALLAIEDHRTGLPWRLLASHPSTARALAAAGLRIMKEPAPRRLKASR